MNNNEYFRIETIEELKEAYEMFKDDWVFLSLDKEIEHFKESIEYRYIIRASTGAIYLSNDFICYDFKEIPSPLNSSSKHSHYDNTSGSLYKFAKDKSLNAWEFDIIKRVVRCRKKGQFLLDLQKTKDVIDLYIKEYKNETD